MDELEILRVDIHSNGTIIPILLTFSNGHTERISTIIETGIQNDGKDYVIRCTTPQRELKLRYSNLKWVIDKIEE